MTLAIDLREQRALVTGGARGLGLTIARALGQAGAHVTLVSRKQADLAEAALQLGGEGLKVDVVAVDLSRPEAIEELVAGLPTRLDILVNNAGTTWGANAEDHPLAAWQKVMDLNVTSAFLLAQQVARRFMIPTGSGRIVNVASTGGLRGSLPGDQTTAAYHASKGALVNLTRALAGEWGRYGVTVNALAPWYFPTDMTRETLRGREAELCGRVPLGRLGEPEDIAGPLLFLASNMSRYVTGQVIPVDGGFMAV